MKFFTSQWWSGCQAGDGADAIKAYQAHAQAIRCRFSPELLALQERVSIHDATLVALNIKPAQRLAVMKLRLADGRDIELRYSGLLSFESIQSPDHALGGPGGYGDLGYDEIDVLDDGSFEHCLLFSSSIEYRFRFVSFELRSPARDASNTLRRIG